MTLTTCSRVKAEVGWQDGELGEDQLAQDEHGLAKSRRKTAKEVVYESLLCALNQTDERGFISLFSDSLPSPNLHL